MKWTTNLFSGSLSVTDPLLKPFSLSRPPLWCVISSLLCRYDLDCKSDNLSKHVSVSFTSDVQQSMMHSWRYYTAKCLPFQYNSILIWIGMSGTTGTKQLCWHLHSPKEETKDFCGPCKRHSLRFYTTFSVSKKCFWLASFLTIFPCACLYFIFYLCEIWRKSLWSVSSNRHLIICIDKCLI